jgi:hypothetical protein
MNSLLLFLFAPTAAKPPPKTIPNPKPPKPLPKTNAHLILRTSDLKQTTSQTITSLYLAFIDLESINS